MVTLTERTIMKSRSGVYSDTAENRRKHRVGQKYGAEKQPEDGEKTEKKEDDPAKELEAVNKVIAAINEGKLTLPIDQIMVLVEKKSKLEAAKKQAEKINAGVKANEEKINEAQIQKIDSKKEEEKTEDGEYITHDKDKIKRYHLFRALKNARKTGAGASDSLKELGYLASSGINSKGKKKYAELFEEFGNKEYIYIDNSRKSEKKEEEKPSLSKEKLESAKDGSSITIKNAQTKNTVISYTKKDGQWFSKNSMTRGEVKASPEQVSKTVEGYNRKTYLTKIDLVEETKSEPKQEASGQASEADKEDLREARKKLAYLQDNEERLIKRDGKEKYEERLKQAKDEVAKLKGEEPQEETKSEPKKEESRGEKKTDKASDPIYQVQQKKKEASKKYDSKREEARQKYDKEADEIRSEIDKLYDQRQKEETSEEVKESYTRVKFEDVPNSGKVNLKKYLSEKVRQGVDEKWSNIKNIPTENLKKMEKGLVNDLNKNFEAIKKSQRAELLYSIMKVKGELESRGKETQKKE